MNNKIKLGFEQFQQFITDEFNALEKAQNESSKLKTIELLQKELQEITNKYKTLFESNASLGDSFSYLKTKHYKLQDDYQSALNKLESHSKNEKELSIVRENYKSLLNKYNNLNTLRKDQASTDLETITILKRTINSISEELTIQNNVNEQLIDALDKLGYKVTILPVKEKPDSAMVFNKVNADDFVDILKKGLSKKYHVVDINDKSKKECTTKRDSKGRYSK